MTHETQTEELRAMNQSDAITRAEFFQLQQQLTRQLSDLSNTCETLSGVITEFKPLVMARSGDLLRIAQIERDLLATHDKHRIHFANYEDAKERVRTLEKTMTERIDRVDERGKQVRWTLMLVWAVAQIIITVLAPLAVHYLTSK